MDDKIINKPDLTNLLQKNLNEKKKMYLILLIFLILVISLIFFLNYNKAAENKKISEQYIKAGVFLVSDQREKAKIIYKDIILSKNKFYSLLALNTIIEKKLVENNDEVLELFTIIEKINIKKEKKDLIKLKKALYLIKISKRTEGNELLKEIISDNSIWKDTAIEIFQQ